ncbi:hypothetical protein NQ317_009082 [Molorchus minor]|uniref:Uncharacterized protein n=1 Tax=Molorchus minor TaxID=1323400 RepID=A0ABQ9JEX3_9CUCU|nr:hypothetical protein NQ317_009082 [Molorchus minor]
MDYKLFVPFLTLTLFFGGQLPELGRRRGEFDDDGDGGVESHAKVPKEGTIADESALCYELVDIYWKLQTILLIRLKKNKKSGRKSNDFTDHGNSS